MFCVAPLWTLALGLLFLNESLTKQLRFPHAPALTHTYLYTHVPAPSWTEPARCFGICVGKAAPPWEALWARGALYPHRQTGLASHELSCELEGLQPLYCAVLPPSGLFEVCLQERGCLWAVVRTRVSAEPSTQCWVTVWNATACRILDSLFLMKIPPVIPRISCSAKKKKRVVCVFCCGLNFFLLFTVLSMSREEEEEGEAADCFLFVVVFVFLLDFCEICGDQSLATNKMFLFLFAKAYGNCRKSIWAFLGKHIGEWTNYSGANMFWMSG